MWMTRCPAASRRAAAATTSITMKGGTLLRVDAHSLRFVFAGRSALSSMMATVPADIRYSRFRQLHYVIQRRVCGPGPVGAGAPLSQHLPAWYRHVWAARVD